MNPTFRKNLKKLILWFIVGFVLLFTFRLMYGYTKNIEERERSNRFFSSVSGKRNYASTKYKLAKMEQQKASVDQKYEKIAEIKTKSSKFEEEERLVRKQITQFNALIQFEQKSGNEGSRILNLQIGVPPENFDSLYHNLIEIGKVQAKQITKKDKTNEYKELNAQRKSLEKIRTSLIALKEKGGKIEEYMSLENRILDIEQQLQDLGVSLGDFDDENEFCTVKFSLLEGKEVKIGLLQRIKVALEWTVKIYFQIMIILFFISVVSYFGLRIIERLKIIEALVNKKE